MSAGPTSTDGVVPLDRRPEDPSSELSLLKLLVEANREEYSELSELWRHLDTKAQGVIAIAGILLAAFVAFITKGPIASCAERTLSIVAISFFTASIGASVYSLKLRESVGPPHFGELQSTIEDFLKRPEEERAKRMPDLIREELSAWRECNDTVRAAIEAKTKLLQWGQVLIGLSIAWLALIAIVRILG